MPDQQPDRQHEAETAAALALLARKRFDLPAIVAAQRIRPHPMRRISPTRVLESDLAAPFLAIVRAWQAEQPAIIAAYQGASLHPALDTASMRTEQTLAFIRRQIAPAIRQIDRWHQAQWISRIRAATGIDVSAFATAADVAPELANAAAWNEALAADLQAQIKGRIASRVIGAATTGTPATRTDAKAAGVDPDTSVESLIADAVAKAKRRALDIAVDQAEKTSAAMTRGRAATAGMGLWRWRHYDPQPHPRLEHIRRAGTVYSSVRPPPTWPGEEPFCKCWQEPLFTLG